MNILIFIGVILLIIQCIAVLIYKTRCLWIKKSAQAVKPQNLGWMENIGLKIAEYFGFRLVPASGNWMGTGTGTGSGSGNSVSASWWSCIKPNIDFYANISILIISLYLIIVTVVSVEGGGGSGSGSESEGEITPPDPDPSKTDNITVTPNTEQIINGGDVIHFAAIARDINGKPVNPQPTISWNSTNASAGNIMSPGVFLANKVTDEQTTTITAFTGGISSAGITIDVRPAGSGPQPPSGTPTCTQVQNPKKYDLTLTWYGVQTSGPLTGGVPTSSMYQQNFQQILDYMIASPLPYSGILLQLDNPVGGKPDKGKPPNYSTDIDTMVAVIDSIPTKFRVGFHAVVESDATWEISKDTILTQLPKDFSFNNTWYGGSGAVSETVDDEGSPYQQKSSCTTSCPYKNGLDCDGKPSDNPDIMPPGCPANMSKLGWYVALINAKLADKGSAQRITMMNWDAEGNGPTGMQCSIFQFMWSILKYSRTDDIKPSKYGKWILYMNGKTSLGDADATTDAYKTPCGYWDKVLGGKLDQLVTFKASPEYYWLEGGEDMGNVKDQPNHGLLDILAKAGYIGCVESAPGKPNYDDKCGCRNTVYETYGHVNDGGIALLNLLDSTYRKYIKASTPTFSIEHLGPTDHTMKFGNCVNTQNFCKKEITEGENWYCGNNSKCIVRCGVANFFGNWTELCFKSFLDNFATRYSIDSIMVYDAGFVPISWLPPKYQTTQEGLDCHDGDTQETSCDQTTEFCGYCPAAIPPLPEQ